MILYTTIPNELIYQVDQNEYTKYKTMMYNGIPIQVEQMENSYRVIRVLSSNPYDFMNNDITPGQLISFS